VGSGAFHVKGATLLDLIRLAYRGNTPVLPEALVLGAESWLDQNLFEVDAATNGSMSEDQVVVALRGLLADRFKVRVRQEKQTVPAYALVRVRKNKLGKSLHPSTQRCTDPEPFFVFVTGPAFRCSARFSQPVPSIALGDITMDYLAWALTERVEVMPADAVKSRIVTNWTGLPGRWDADVRYSVADPPSAPLSPTM
jgi:uncharacterized protein (TIGR03435 family)